MNMNMKITNKTWKEEKVKVRVWIEEQLDLISNNEQSSSHNLKAKRLCEILL